MGNKNDVPVSAPKPAKEEQSSRPNETAQTTEATQIEESAPASGTDNIDNPPDNDHVQDDPPPYCTTEPGEEESDNTSVKRDLSSESKKSPPDKEALDDLKLTIEKSNIDLNERLASLETSLKSNIEQQEKTSKALTNLQDTVLAYFESRNEDVNTTLLENGTSRREQFTERLGKEVVDHLLNSELLKTLLQQRDTDINQTEKMLKTDKGLDQNIDKADLVVRECSEEPEKSKDSGPWRLCLSKSKSNLEHEAKRLLDLGVLPDKHLLNQCCRFLTRKSKLFQSICQCICRYIRAKSSIIVNVWAAFQFNKSDKILENEIIFVVITQKPKALLILEFQTYQRCLHNISDICSRENLKIQLKENAYKFYDTKIEKVTKCLKDNAKQLMEKHKNLSRVTLSWIKSSGFATEQCQLKRSPCIALYVQIKGLVPIDEDPFEEFVEGYPVDVREGAFNLCGSSKDLHQNVKMGCALDSGFGSSEGTIGPFIRFQSDPHIYLLTSAHVLLNPDQMKRLIIDKNVYYGICGNDAYQPPESTTLGHGFRHHLGKVELAVYKEGGNGDSGMEIALVKIDEDRIPVDGKFPDLDFHHNDFGTSNPFEFQTDQVCNFSNISSSTDVYKYGACSGLTKGKVRIQGSSVRASMLEGNYMGADVVLHNQIEIESFDDELFGIKGDSGSFVLKKENDQLAAVGLFEGKMDNIYMVTPIIAIREELSKVLSLYRDPPTQTEMEIDDDKFNMAMKLFYVPTSINSTQQTVEAKNISEEISRHTSDMQRHIMHSTDHKIQSVKTELTVIKQHIENTKNEIMSNMQEMENRVTENISSQIERLFMHLQSQRNS